MISKHFILIFVIYVSAQFIKNSEAQVHFAEDDTNSNRQPTSHVSSI